MELGEQDIAKEFEEIRFWQLWSCSLSGPLASLLTPVTVEALRERFVSWLQVERKGTAKEHQIPHQRTGCRRPYVLTLFKRGTTAKLYRAKETLGIF